MKKTLFIAAILSVFGLQSSICDAQDAIYKLLRHEWTVNTDGTSDYHYRREIQILRNRALTAYADKGETFVVFNPDLETVTVNEVYTIQKDGTRVNMPQNAFIYQLPSECADCGRFNHFRELAMVHTGMELGCTIVVDYTIHRQYNLVSRTIDLVMDHPVEKLEVAVRVPDDQELNVKLNNPGVIAFNPTVEQTEHSYSLSASNVPQNFSDYYMPANELLYPSLHFFNGTPQYQPEFDRNGLAESKSAIGKLINSSDPKKNVVSIRNYVIDNIHLNNIDPAKLGYRHATAAEVWQSGCGTPIDKAVLLAAMLNEWGYNARVIEDEDDEVGVTLDTLEYRLSATYRSPLTLHGEAKDEVTQVRHNRNHAKYRLDTLQDGFFQLKFAPISESPDIDARWLALTRTAPLATPQCDIAVCDEYPLDKDMKLVGDKVSQKLAFDGIGSVEVSVKQSGKKLVVNRKLTIEKSMISPSEYANYRQMIALWQSIDRVLLRKK